MKTLSTFLVAAALGVAALDPSIAASDVLATGPDGIRVTSGEALAEAAQRLPDNVRTKALEDPRNVVTLVNDIAIRRVLAAQAEKAKLDEDPAIALKLRLARERVLADARLAQLETQQPDRATLEKAARAEYTAQSQKYSTPEQVRVRHILIDGRSCNPEAQIARILEQARQPGADFAALAREYSQDPGTAKRGGDLGFFGRGRMAPEFEEAAFALAKPGDLSGVVSTSFGLHIIQLEERKPAGREPFDKVQEAIIQDLVNRDSRNRRREATEPIAAVIQLDQDAIAEFSKQPH